MKDVTWCRIRGRGMALQGRMMGWQRRRSVRGERTSFFLCQRYTTKGTTDLRKKTCNITVIINKQRGHSIYTSLKFWRVEENAWERSEKEKMLGEEDLFNGEKH